MKTQHQNLIKQVTGMDGIPFVVAGIAADCEGHVISEDGMIAIAEKLEAAEQTTAQIATLTTAKEKAESDLKVANAAKEKAEGDLKTLTEAKTLVDAELKQLKEKDGGRFSGAGAADDKNQEGGGDDLKQFVTSVDTEVK